MRFQTLISSAEGAEDGVATCKFTSLVRASINFQKSGSSRLPVLHIWKSDYRNLKKVTQNLQFSFGLRHSKAS